jgi:hypothetical protein
MEPLTPTGLQNIAYPAFQSGTDKVFRTETVKSKTFEVNDSNHLKPPHISSHFMSILFIHERKINKKT